jgi:hypothetical protein
MRRENDLLLPLPACGQRSSVARVRGPLRDSERRNSAPGGEAPSSQPSPRTRGEGGASVARTNSFARHCERSEAIQWPVPLLDCFVAEPVIGPATSGRTRWLLAMTPDRETEFLFRHCRGLTRLRGEPGGDEGRASPQVCAQRRGPLTPALYPRAGRGRSARRGQRIALRARRRGIVCAARGGSWGCVNV